MSDWKLEMEEYSKVADTHLKKSFAIKNYLFFQEFFKEENLKKYLWEDFQKIGEHIHAFLSMALARKKAFGNPNHPIEHYQKSFCYLAHGPDSPNVRIENFMNKEEYKIRFLGSSAASEIIGYVFADRFFMLNRRDDYALTQFNLMPKFERGDGFVEKLQKSTDALKPLVDDYIRIVKPRTNLPLYIEIDQFFSYFYEKNSDPSPEPIPTEEQLNRLWERFHKRIKGFSDFKNPGQHFLEEEITHKKRCLEKFNEFGGPEALKELVNQGKAIEALKKLTGFVQTNFVSFHSWRNTFGEKEETIRPILSAFLNVAEQPYQGQETLTPLFEAIRSAGTKPSWDALTVTLWALRPQDYVPTKIEYLRTLADELGIEIPKGKPTKEKFEVLQKFFRDIRVALDPWKPEDWIEVQSFLWVVRPPIDRPPQYWLISAGENAEFWERFQGESHIAFGSVDTGDLRQHQFKSEYLQLIKEKLHTDKDRTNDAQMYYDFVHEMQKGDTVIVKQGTGRILGVGVIQSDYRYAPEYPTYKNVRDVEWKTNRLYELPESGSPRLPIKTLTNVTERQDLLAIVEHLLEEQILTPLEVPTYTLDVALQELFIQQEQLEEILTKLRQKKNIILQGPPGVGKTFMAKRLAYLLMTQKDHSRIEMIQFHQSYSYEDFIQGYRPNNEGTFSLCNGVFYDFCLSAQKDPDRSYFFIIDEINRGNLSKIFGELMMLIESDKRGEEFAIRLTYSTKDSQKFYLPSNLYFIGTMNTADRSLAMVDYALRRRFAFITLQPAIAYPKFYTHLLSRKVPEAVADRIVKQVSALNELITSDRKNLGAGYCIGHSYFCPRSESAADESWYQTVVRTEIAPLLQEYWFDREEKVQEILASLLSE